MVLAVAQPLCLPLDVDHNARAHAELVRAAGARVVVFPELSLTGYHLDAPELDPSDPRLEPLRAACAETGAVALAGAPVEGHIALLAVGPRETRVAYRKRFLGDEEARRFRPGCDPVVLELDGWRLGLAICKDLNVPEHAAELAMDAYLAGTVKHPHEASRQEERARALARERGIWVAVASAAGSTGEGYAPAAGLSGIWAPGGEPRARLGAEPGQAIGARLEA